MEVIRSGFWEWDADGTLPGAFETLRLARDGCGAGAGEITAVLQALMEPEGRNHDQENR